MTRFAPSGPLRGKLRPPPDKSISHRAALIGSMCDDTVEVEGYLESADTESTLEAVRRLGAGVDSSPGGRPGAFDLKVTGIGLQGPGEHRRRELDQAHAGEELLR